MFGKLVDSMLKHPHCYQWTLALLAFVVAILTSSDLAIWFAGFTLGLATYAQVKRIFARAFFVA